MVGIVIVAHSAALAYAVKALAEQVAQGAVLFAASGGIDDPENPYGTDVVKIREAIESVYSEAGVVVLMDMGSSVLSAEMALEFLPEDKRSRVRLCEAPLVEGAMAAVVCSKGGGSLHEVVNEARAALAGKAAQLGVERPERALKQVREGQQPWNGLAGGETGTERDVRAPVREMELILRNPLGIHARPAAQFVFTASRFKSDIRIRNATTDTVAVSAKSINRITTLDRITITAEGPDAEDALAALKDLVEGGFGERAKTGEVPWESELPRKTPAMGDEQVKPVLKPQAIATGGKLAGVPASPGIAIAPALQFRPAAAEVLERKPDDPGAEYLRLNTAIEAVKRHILQMKMRMSVHIGEYEASLFDAYRLSLEDPALIEVARKNILERAENAEKAWQHAVDDMIRAYKDAESSYIQQRATDLADLKAQVLQGLMGRPSLSPSLREKSILLAAEFSASDVARLDPEMTAGLCTSSSGANSHSAILARSLGIPMVVGLGPGALGIPDGTTLVIDGAEGIVRVNPDQIGEFRKRQEACLASRQKAYEASRRPAITLDGKRIELLANISYAAEVLPALRNGAEGIGLFRTEFLFLKRFSAPSEEEQLAAYRSIAEILGMRPFIVRTLDAGGDKSLPYLELPPEDNPFLGERGIRISLSHRDLFKTQLRAILRAAEGHCIKLLLPMISSVQEVRSVSALMAEAQAELAREGLSFDSSLEIGVMVEVPSAVVLADRLASEVDFFSIGTNDLAQYVMAADRTNVRLSSLSDALHPAVLRMIQQTAKAGREVGIRTALCGEIAAESVAVPILLGLGIDELSMGGSAIPLVKETIAQLRIVQCESLATEVLDLTCAEEVREYVKGRLGNTFAF
jgi:phosphocarrier protein FPr